MIEFYTLKPEVVAKIRQRGLSKTESKLFFYLLELDPFGDRPAKVKVAEILLATGISKAAYHNAISVFEALGFFDFKHTDVVVSNLSVKKPKKLVQDSGQQSKKLDQKSRILDSESKILDQKSRILDNECPNVAPCAESIVPQTYSDLLQIDPDRSDDEFFDFENANSDAALRATDESKLSDFESMIYSCTDEAVEKCDLNRVDEVDLTNTPEQPVNPDGGDPFRRRVEDFILKSLQVSPRDRTAYFSRFTQADWEKWEARMSPPVSPPPPPLFVPEVVEVCSPEIALANIAKIKEMLARGAK